MWIAAIWTFGEPDIAAQPNAPYTSTMPFPETTDILIIGAGIAGLSFALSLPLSASITLVTKGALGESNTRYAQGGVAAAISGTDSPELHLQDTIEAGAGLVDSDAGTTLVGSGKEAVEWLIEHGTRFDEDDGVIALGNEAAHSRSRVLHAGGDATGAEIERALVERIAERHDLTVLEHTTAIDLLISGERCTGARLSIGHDDHRFDIHAGTVVLALGGAGQLWAVTSNPSGATGDGIALALRAGVTVADLEFTQFHPTVLDAPGHDPFLISEAVRGDGALLRNDAGERFMLAIHERADLAPRDVVARAILDQIASGSQVWLDLRHLDATLVRRRFPTIARHLGGIGIDLTADLIPVAPAAHYFMGGIAALPDGRTSMLGLLGIGEVSCTGVHGANRLASNSLLEGLVFGRIAAAHLEADAFTIRSDGDIREFGQPTGALNPDLPIDAAKQQLQAIMRDHVSVVRSRKSLITAQDELDRIAYETDLSGSSLPSAECRNMWLLAREITSSALHRQESRGGHFRSDFPQTSPDLDGQHQLVRFDQDGANRRFGSLTEAIQPVSG